MNAVGIPKGVYQVLHGFGPGSAGEFITKHLGVNGITFTGETRTGEAIMAAAAKGVRPVSFELGGKKAGIVFADADFEKAVAGMRGSAFENCGQVCLGTERVYVQRPIFEKFVAALKASAEGLKVGPSHEPGVNLGPLISAEHKEKVLGYYAKARAEGATVVTGGGVPEMKGEFAEGHFVLPTIWTGLPESAAVLREEIFSPSYHLAPPPSTPRRKRSHWPTPPPTAWPPPCGRRTWAPRTAWPPRSMSACAGSIPGSCATCAPPSADRKPAASVARAACIRWSSTPNCAT